MKKTLIALSFASIAFLTACGTGQEAENQVTENQVTENQVATETETQQQVPDNLEPFTVGATSVSAHVLRQAIPIMAEKGFELIVQDFDDFILPNIALYGGELDANLFQTPGFLDNWNYGNNGDLVRVFGIYFFPMRLYSGRQDSVENIQPGAVIAVPDDLVNEARSLIVLQDLELIGLDYHGLATTADHIIYNPHNIVIQPMAADILASILPDVDFAVINGNFANMGGVLDRAVILENGEPAGEGADSAAAITFTNYLVVREANENAPGTVALVESLQHADVTAFILSEYGDTVVLTWQ